MTEDLLEDFARLETSARYEFAEVHEHVSGCDLCRERLEDLHEFLAFMREDPEDTEGEILRRHETEHGTVFLLISGSDATSWEARAIGAGVYAAREFLRGAHAKAHLEEWFAQAFEGHRCGKGCGSGWITP